MVTKHFKCHWSSKLLHWLAIWIYLFFIYIIRKLNYVRPEWTLFRTVNHVNNYYGITEWFESAFSHYEETYWQFCSRNSPNHLDQDLNTTSRNPKPAIERKHRSQSIRRRNAERFTQWMDSKKSCFRCYPRTYHQYKRTKHLSDARDTVIGIPHTPSTYRVQSKGVNINTDIVLTTPRNKRCRMNLREGFDIYGLDLLCTPHTSPISMPDPDAIQTVIASLERPDTSNQPQPPRRSKKKGKRAANPNLPK